MVVERERGRRGIVSTCPEDDNSYCQLFRRTEASIKLCRDPADLQRLHTSD